MTAKERRRNHQTVKDQLKPVFGVEPKSLKPCDHVASSGFTVKLHWQKSIKRLAGIEPATRSLHVIGGVPSSLSATHFKKFPHRHAQQRCGRSWPSCITGLTWRPSLEKLNLTGRIIKKIFHPVNRLFSFFLFFPALVSPLATPPARRFHRSPPRLTRP